MRSAFLLTLMCALMLAIGVAWAEPQADVYLPPPEKTIRLPKVLSLREAILLALRNNPNIQSGEIQRVADKFALEVARNAYEPQVTLTGSATYGTGQAPQYNIGPNASWLTAPGTKLATTYTSSFNGPGSSTLTMSATQPLLQGFGTTVTLTPLYQAEYTEQVNRLTLKNTVITTITQVIQAYYNLVSAYNQLTINQIQLESSIRTLNQYKAQVKAGRAAAMDIVQQQSQIASLQVAVTQSKNSIEQAYQALLVILGLDPHSHIEVDKSLAINPIKLPTLEESEQLALNNSIAYLQSIYSVKQAQANLLLAKDQQKWQLNLVATETISPGGGSTTTSVDGDTTTITSIAGNQGTIALNLNIPLNQKSIQQALVDAEVGLEQQRIALENSKRTLRSQVLAALQSLQYQEEQVVQAEGAVKYAQLALNVELIKLRYGRSTLFEVTQLRDNLTTAKLNLVSQQIGYINTLAAFYQTLGTTLDKWAVQINY